ncbi:SitI6 family double-CXXCG motif immunity protein [Pyxidicoccus xibeiensis]|uniref:SitI6 family double-CXXCG motif immunity protein n=1 Tax=Pyxidicoccus xibeiensis TaxID=2906759 RepID=UPI0020A79E29|nr:double-CXXCG motif protein [Pyxidicoccus xibeiensis]MCP3140012.1 double-CXXCG motif protein [Pyxidicoccus xibeiensis]
MRFYQVEEDRAAGYTGDLRAVPRWGFPGITACPGCGAGGGQAGLQYPCVDLSSLPELERKELEDPGRQVGFEDFLRLRERVRPHAPGWARLEPGADFGPLTGTASGTFGPLFMQNPWSLYLRREALEQLQGVGVRGLTGCPLAVRFREKSPPGLLALQLELHGRFHPDCLPPDRTPPCPKCGSVRHAMPEPPILDAASLPEHTDLFRLDAWTTLIVASQRLVEAVQRLALDGVSFRELRVR